MNPAQPWEAHNLLLTGETEEAQLTAASCSSGSPPFASYQKAISTKLLILSSTRHIALVSHSRLSFPFGFPNTWDHNSSPRTQQSYNVPILLTVLPFWRHGYSLRRTMSPRSFEVLQWGKGSSSRSPPQLYMVLLSCRGISEEMLAINKEDYTAHMLLPTRGQSHKSQKRHQEAQTFSSFLWYLHL